MNTVAWILWLIAAILFGIASVGWSVRRVNFIALGLCLASVAVLINAGAPGR